MDRDKARKARGKTERNAGDEKSEEADVAAVVATLLAGSPIAGMIVDEVMDGDGPLYD